ncbi:DUF718 domain-containing protein [Sinorhizobium numidicum]|uniref:DUF718 domain-containing protein n=1 Tax=Sinorhizobium numidicum TaxID=680248 RepID=A0ABY8CVP4_9HYPH|nr:DUF718 domain-containing protein [Sinorhizobium numidicum]WEX76054.1 DUF718 domain-containing protein [Sinorhizobium numidicum]WEX82713.1 DUF718 domain-containing protein [Sinorhizobium numidicum]
MTAYNVVKFRVKPGEQGQFESWYRELPRNFDGLRKVSLIKTGERHYCAIGEWESFDHMVAARPLMVGNLEKFRHTLEDLGEERGVTDAVSGEAIYESVPNK